MNIIDDLMWRGAINQMTDEEGLRQLTQEKQSHYTVVWTQQEIVCILDI